jgi:hypothetical protein
MLLSVLPSIAVILAHAFLIHMVSCLAGSSKRGLSSKVRIDPYFASELSYLLEIFGCHCDVIATDDFTRAYTRILNQSCHVLLNCVEGTFLHRDV